MKKIVLNISDATYEKFRFEAIKEEKSFLQVIVDRLMQKPFDEEVIEAFEAWTETEINKIIEG
jgi:hypothetical protein